MISFRKHRITFTFQSLPSTEMAQAVQFNTSRPRKNGRCFTNDIYKCILLNEKIWILIRFSLKFVPKGLINNINNITALVQTMTWCRPGNKPLSEAMMVKLLTHICISLPHWIKPMEDMDTFNLYIQCYGCWWLGYTRSQSIINHDIDLVVLEYSGACLNHPYIHNHKQMEL